MTENFYSPHFMAGKAYIVLERILQVPLPDLRVGSAFSLLSAHPGNQLEIKVHKERLLHLVKYEQRKEASQPAFAAQLLVHCGVKQLDLCHFAMDELTYTREKLRASALTERPLQDLCERILLSSLKEFLIHECRAN